MTSLALRGEDRMTIISADCHAGGSVDDYRPYLPASMHEKFDEWKGKYTNPFKDLTDDTKSRNFDDERRNAELFADGVVAEVVFPNTVPPFFPINTLLAPPPSERSYTRRLEGLRAHNRWLVDFCGRLPGQRVGLPQLFLNNIDDAIEDVTWAAENGFRSMLVPHVSPGYGVLGLHHPDYEPLWDAFAEHDMVITQHGGSGIPSYDRVPATPFLMLMEVPFFAQRSVWQLILTGVFERHPNLKYVMTEQGTAWVPPALDRMDHFWEQSRATGGVGEMSFKVEELLPLKPSEYFKRQCWIGASFPAPSDAAVMHGLGIDRIMWGSDYPHREGTYPKSREALRNSFSDFSAEDLNRLLWQNAAEVYGFDVDACAASAAEHGPTLAELQEPLTEIPDHWSPAFTRG